VVGLNALRNDTVVAVKLQRRVTTLSRHQCGYRYGSSAQFWTHTDFEYQLLACSGSGAQSLLTGPGKGRVNELIYQLLRNDKSRRYQPDHTRFW